MNCTKNNIFQINSCFQLENTTGNKYLYHVSEQPGIEIFVPRPSPSLFKAITGNVVFAIEEDLLHNYLLPRNCPRVCFYAGKNTTEKDRAYFMGNESITHVIAVEEKWLSQIENTKLYCYGFDTKHFILLDACAGYYVSYLSEKPVEVLTIESPLAALQQKKALELRIMKDIVQLAEEVRHSTLNFSLIRMRNANATGNKQDKLK